MKLNTQKNYKWLMSIFTFIVVLFMFADKYVRPYVFKVLYESEFKLLTYECDMAMHEEAAIRQYDPADEKYKGMKLSADVGMLVCHKYDKLRKKLLIHGLTDNELALMSLDSLETEKVTVKKMVDAHRMDRF